MKTNEKMLSALISRLQLPAVTAVCRGTPQAATETDGNAAHRRQHGVQLGAEDDERVGIRRDFRAQTKRQDDRRRAMTIRRRQQPVPHVPVRTRGHLRAHKAVRERKGVFGDGEERRQRRGIELLQGLLRHARTAFGRFEKPHVVKRSEAIAVRRQYGQGILRRWHKLVRRQTGLNRARRRHGLRHVVRWPDENRHEVGGRRAHGGGNRLHAVPDQIVQRRADGDRPPHEQARRQRKQRHGRTPQDGASPQRRRALGFVL